MEMFKQVTQMVKMVLGKIIVANFTNQSGLKQIGNSTFIETAASGKVELGQASEDGFGQILSVLSAPMLILQRSW